MTKIKVMNCNGDCLRQTDYVNTYYRDPESNCTNNCLPVVCPNYILCGNVSPKFILDYNGSRCINCNIIFACNLEF